MHPDIRPCYLCARLTEQRVALSRGTLVRCCTDCLRSYLDPRPSGPILDPGGLT